MRGLLLFHRFRRLKDEVLSSCVVRFLGFARFSPINSTNIVEILAGVEPAFHYSLLSRLQPRPVLHRITSRPPWQSFHFLSTMFGVVQLQLHLLNYRTIFLCISHLNSQELSKLYISSYHQEEFATSSRIHFQHTVL